jgi:hypothetical protein
MGQTIQAATRIKIPTGLKRKYITIMLVVLHRHTEINDKSGQAGRALLAKAGITTPVTPQEFSHALKWCWDNQLVGADIDAGRNYAMFRLVELDDESIAHLTADMAWALQAVTRPDIDQAEPPRRHIRPRRIKELTATVEQRPDGTEELVYSSFGQSEGQTPALPTPAPPVNGQSPAYQLPINLPPAGDQAAFLRYILDLEELIRAQRDLIAQLSGQDYPKFDSVSDEVAALLEGRTP